MLNPAQELFFWTGIMRDHGEFQLTALSSREPQFVMASQFYKNAFAGLNSEAEKLLSSPDTDAAGNLVYRAIPLLLNFINYKRLLVRRLLECAIEINFPPSFINHMINEAMDFYTVLCMLTGNPQLDKVSENILMHKIWLPDASGHASAIAASLDPTEMLLIKEANEFKKIFDGLYIKAAELELMLQRACLTDGSLAGLNEEAQMQINNFICFLEKILKLRSTCMAMGFFKALMADHMIREEKYYLSTLKSFCR